MAGTEGNTTHQMQGHINWMKGRIVGELETVAPLPPSHKYLQAILLVSPDGATPDGNYLAYAGLGNGPVTIFLGEHSSRHKAMIACEEWHKKKSGCR